MSVPMLILFIAVLFDLIFTLNNSSTKVKVTGLSTNSAAVYEVTNTLPGGLLLNPVRITNATLTQNGSDPFETGKLAMQLDGGWLYWTASQIKAFKFGFAALPRAKSNKNINFDDFWYPMVYGQGSFGTFFDGLSETRRDRLRIGVRAAYLAGDNDGHRGFASVAWAVKGIA